MRCHDFGSGREVRRSQYREYWQGERQCHGPKLVPARRVAAKTGGAPRRGAGAPLAGMRPRRCAQVLRIRARYCPAAGSHPSIERLEPAPPRAGHFVGRLDHIRDMACTVLRVSANFGSNAHLFHYVRDSKRRKARPQPSHYRPFRVTAGMLAAGIARRQPAARRGGGPISPSNLLFPLKSKCFCGVRWGVHIDPPGLRL